MYNIGLLNAVPQTQSMHNAFVSIRKVDTLEIVRSICWFSQTFAEALPQVYAGDLVCKLYKD